MTNEPSDYLPISMLNQLEYCERRFYLMQVLGEMEINAHVLEGSLRHEQAHSGASERQGNMAVHRRVYVWSDELELAGFADIVEESVEGSPDEGSPKKNPAAVSLVPVEYKKGKMGRWLNDYVQLCAQALCLEERTGVSIDKGYVFYFGSRRRQEVVFSAELRNRTRGAAARARELVNINHLPAPLTQAAKCRDCSLEPVCLPQETTQLLEYPKI